MIEIKLKKDCCGCGSCCNACPKGAIKMVEDEYGFKYPYIDQEKCIDCGICEKVCPMLKKKKVEFSQKAYACINKDDSIRKESSSGGVFTILAQKILEENGAVFGASFNDEFNVQHICIEKEEELYKLRGSKYVQSNINDTYKLAKARLEKGQTVLFSGTPCQIQGLKSFLNKEYDKLYVVDIICHGVPSPKVWNKYKSEIEDKNSSKIEVVTFREKSTGWNTYSFNAKLENKNNVKEKFTDNAYMKIFLSDFSLRDFCYDCKFKDKTRASDITLADFWGIEKVLPDMHDNKGTSLVVINSKKGQELLEIIKPNITIKQVKLEEAIKYNTSYNKSVQIPEERAKFFIDLDKMSFEELAKKYIYRPSIIKRILRKINKKIKYIIKEYKK